MSLALWALWSPGPCLDPAITSLRHPTPLLSEATHTDVPKVPGDTTRPVSHALPIAITWLTGWRGVAGTKRLIFREDHEGGVLRQAGPALSLC